MIVRNDILPYFELSIHVRDSQFSPYVKRMRELDLKQALDEEQYEAFFATYDLVLPIVSIASNVLELSDTTQLVDFDYLLFRDVRTPYTVIDTTHISVSTLPASTPTEIKYICKKADFDKILPFAVFATLVKYGAESVIQSTNGGLKQKNDDYSDFLSPQLLHGLLASWKSDLKTYAKELKDYFKKTETAEPYRASVYQVKRRVPNFKNTNL